MCKGRPLPRCQAHAKAELAKHQEKHPGLASLTDTQLRSAHAQALSTKQPAKARILAREMDLRLDVDATKEGIRDLKNALTSDPANPDLWYRYNAAVATYASKNEFGEAYSPTHGRESNAQTLAERRERLARMEGRASASLVTHGTLSTREVSALVSEYDAVLECEAAARLVAAHHKPDPEHASPADLRSWRGAVAGVQDGLAHLARGADQFAVRSHKAAAIATWTYPHQLPPARFARRRDITGSPLDGVRVALLTRAPVRYENGQIRVDSEDNMIRAKLWHAGYPVSTPEGPVVIRPTGVTSAAA